MLQVAESQMHIIKMAAGKTESFRRLMIHPKKKLAEVGVKKKK